MGATDSALGTAKSVYATGVRAVGDGLTKVGVLGDQAPDRDDRVRHWAYSLFKVHDSLAIAAMDVPWWTYAAIDTVELWLETRPGHLRAYEYGSGASTVWLARRFGEVHSVEHHRGFGEKMARELAAVDNVTLRIVEPTASSAPAVPSLKEDHGGLDFEEYVRSIEDTDGDFDLVVVDGRAREACLAAAVPRLARGGIIVYDNSWRRRYRPAIQSCGLREHRLRGLTPTLPYPDQTSILAHPRS